MKAVGVAWKSTLPCEVTLGIPAALRSRFRVREGSDGIYNSGDSGYSITKLLPWLLIEEIENDLAAQAIGKIK